jgi:tetratricopeptide (TPR) repeat protein
MPGLIKSLSRNTNARLPHRLLAEELKLRLQPNERDATVTNLVAEFSNAALTNRVEVGRWLNRQHEFAHTLELLSAPDALKDRDAFLVRVDALAALGKWKEARDELETPAAPLEPILRELYLARAAKELKLTPEADAHWRRVHLELSSKPEAMLYVAQYAEQIGELDEARKAYERLAAVPEFTDKGYAGMIRIAEELGGTRTLREIMRDLSARRPDDPAPENDFAYLNLLLNERIDTSKEVAQKLFDAHTNVMAFRNTLALAYLRLEKPAEAKKIYDGLNLDWRVLKPGWQAVHAAVVGANGETYLARTLARQIPLSALKPEEKALIQPWL